MGVKISTSPVSCKVKLISCCANPSSAKGDEFQGLALLPARPSTTGKPCTAQPCNSCPNMSADSLGVASLGNGNFAIRLLNAPSNASVAIAALGFGACQKNGVGIGLCGPIRITLNSVLTVVVPLRRGAGSCSASSLLPLPIPPDSRLCGLKISAQFLTVCIQGTRIGTGLTNCLEIPITR